MAGGIVVLIVPVIIALFGQYLAPAMEPESTAQKPEKLFREGQLIASPRC